MLTARWPGPTIELDQGAEFYLSLTNVGTVMRPDLFDPHTVHFHGFPNAATVFDGVPEVSISINMGGTLTYYYNIMEPGTFIYHCHVEATEHMEMGMLANLYVHPLQDELGCFDEVGGVPTPNGNCLPGTRKDPGSGGPTGYTYNDNDGTTAWDVEAPIQVSGFDSDFHDASIQVQPLPFASLEADYPQINGRGYPHTVWDPVGTYTQLELQADADGDGVMPHPVQDAALTVPGFGVDEPLTPDDPTTSLPLISQDMGSGIEVTAGQRLLLRLSNVAIDRFYTLTAPGLTMKQIGTGARLMRGFDGKNLYVDTASVNFGGGETTDVIVDTTGVAPGTYFLHAADLHQMSNATQLTGGMITEIVVN
jgi:FtsP/CotA-like multicopper oxidase with cupredoxin domain